MPTVPIPIDAAPTVPVRGDRVNFATQTQAWTVWEKVAYPQSTALGLNVYANAVEAYNASVAAAASAAAAQALAGAVLFNPATNYLQGEGAISGLNFLLYRRMTAGISAADPKNDAVNWAPAGFPPVVLVRTAVNFTAVAGITYILTANDVQMTLPAAAGSQDMVPFRLGVGVSRALIKGNGNKVEGQAVGVDLSVSTLGMRGQWNFNATDGWLLVP